MKVAPGSVGNFLGDEPVEAPAPAITAVRAYFACNSIESTKFSEFHPPQIKVHFGAMYGDKEGSLSKDYSDATPSGALWMQINESRPAAKFFRPGKKYFLTFTEAPD